MTTYLRRSTISVLGLFALLVGRGSTAEPTEVAATPATLTTPAIEIDYSVLVIDVAAERRALDASIRRELARRAAAQRQRELKLAAFGARRRG